MRLSTLSLIVLTKLVETVLRSKVIALISQSHHINRESALLRTITGNSRQPKEKPSINQSTSSIKRNRDLSAQKCRLQTRHIIKEAKVAQELVLIIIQQSLVSTDKIQTT